MEKFGIWFVPEPNTGCWLWNRATTNLGYGQIQMGGRERSASAAYRVSYETLRGRIPPGMDLDHLCRQPLCVNPDHLEPVTHQENIRRGRLAVNKSCPKGHEYSPENTKVYRGARFCRECHRISNRGKYVRKTTRPYVRKAAQVQA